MSKLYLGYKAEDLQSQYTPFLAEEVIDIQDHVKSTVDIPSSWEDLLPLEKMTDLEQAGDLSQETGYAVKEDGSIMVAVKTLMPNTTPKMWDWWFGWHGSDNKRYKLWHPGAHLSAEWEDGRSDNCYIGRTSIIREYIGATSLDAAIQFKSPLEFGFSHDAVNRSDQALYICAKIGHPQFPVDYGYLVHQVRVMTNGTEMRSRFWMSGQFVSARTDNFLNKAAVKILQKFKTLPDSFGQDLMIHCAEEMRHLAS
ncbi:MAG: hypothetical protein AAF598_18370, partial [Bacteroidota bacterium]